MQRCCPRVLVLRPVVSVLALEKRICLHHCLYVALESLTTPMLLMAERLTTHVSDRCCSLASNRLDVVEAWRLCRRLPLSLLYIAAVVAARH